MVGVPGKSQGCLTCRRRKIGCDLSKPNCQRCTKSGRVCEGYARYPTFLNTTLEGRQKRFRLEEAKPRSSVNTTISSTSSSTALNTTSNQIDTDSSDETSTSDATRLTLFRQTSNSDLRDDQLIACFYNNFIPKGVLARDLSPALWLQQILLSGAGSPAMRSSLKALAMTRLGWLNGDRALCARGRGQYGIALTHLQKALYDKTLAWQDETLAAAYCLSIYELFEATDGSIKGWNSHVSGVGHLIQLRGPNHYCTPLARAVLHSFSSASMIQSVQFRKKAFLDSQEWRSKPWKHNAKDIYQRLLEYGFEFGTLSEEADNSRLREGELDLQHSISYPQRYSALNKRMDIWFQDFLAESPSPLFWLSSEDGSGAPESAHYNPFIFPSLRLATITLCYWALKLVISGVTASICGALLSKHPALKNNAPDAFANPQERENLLQLLRQCSKAYNVKLATNIMRTMAYILSDSMGLIGAQQGLFPLRVALSVLRQYPGEELWWCQAIYQQLDKRKGLRYATHIAKTDGKYAKD
ncbi:MAG: hypothetical protein Q9217_005091 [Psora testacea]